MPTMKDVFSGKKKTYTVDQGRGNWGHDEYLYTVHFVDNETGKTIAELDARQPDELSRKVDAKKKELEAQGWTEDDSELDKGWKG